MNFFPINTFWSNLKIAVLTSKALSMWIPAHYRVIKNYVTLFDMLQLIRSDTNRSEASLQSTAHFYSAIRDFKQPNIWKAIVFFSHLVWSKKFYL